MNSGYGAYGYGGGMVASNGEGSRFNRQSPYNHGWEYYNRGYGLKNTNPRTEICYGQVPANGYGNGSHVYDAHGYGGRMATSNGGGSVRNDNKSYRYSPYKK